MTKSLERTERAGFNAPSRTVRITAIALPGELIGTGQQAVVNTSCGEPGAAILSATRAIAGQHFVEVHVRKNLWRPFWIKIGLAAMTGVLALVTPLCLDWIEVVFGWNPDQHSGSVEWSMVASLFLLTVGLFELAALEWRRATVVTLI
jgi:hypothetical protein